MQEIKVSIIIPVYNVSEYLNRCLDSLEVGLHPEWEIILVNDGSTDDSLEICNAFAAKYDNVVVIDKPNGGLSDARNSGVSIAKGEWFFFLDSDDYLAKGAIESILGFATENNCDIVQGGIYYAYPDHLLYDSRSMKCHVLDNNQAMRALVLNDIVKNFAWGKLYKAELVKNLQFPKGKFFEDSYWQHLVVSKVRRYGILTKPLYYYIQRGSSISGTFSTKLLDLLKGNEERLLFIKSMYPQLIREMTEFYWNSVFELYHTAAKSGDEGLERVYDNYYHYVLSEYGDMFKENLRYNLFWIFREKAVLLNLLIFSRRALRRIAFNHYKSVKKS